MVSKKTLSLVGAIAFLASTAAFAAGSGKWAKGMEMLDGNKDGQITLEELQKFEEERFKLMDSNGDGQISFAEMEAEKAAKRAERMKSHFDRMDLDASGSLSAEELAARGNKMMERLDENKDGIITEDEFPRHADHKN
ncbi:EF-hand domain-containing protein [Kiloniella laminariae]|uniref:EF-hand domain-containing protein n=1 Tax=Kiloniella laminariae TaxID=454162 RepID=A0ABT4LMY0_9PROT|nr:EF-hand domain-containing protein [Kiloniella laminariae]MCZ4282434.1 EF-hand domain-containing protein [Kiloniella laminariae]